MHADTISSRAGANALVPHELHVLVPGEGERHHEGPGAAKRPGGRIDQFGAGAEVHLRRLPRIEGEAHRGVGRKRRKPPANPSSPDRLAR